MDFVRDLHSRDGHVRVRARARHRRRARGVLAGGRDVGAVRARGRGCLALPLSAAVDDAAAAPCRRPRLVPPDGDAHHRGGRHSVGVTVPRSFREQALCVLVLEREHQRLLRQPGGPPRAPLHAQGCARRSPAVRATGREAQRAHLRGERGVPLREPSLLDPKRRRAVRERHDWPQPVQAAAHRQWHRPPERVPPRLPLRARPQKVQLDQAGAQLLRHPRRARQHEGRQAGERLEPPGAPTHDDVQEAPRDALQKQQQARHRHRSGDAERREQARRGAWE
mmetsp:Transcript_9997/g.32790  ORF Transcript_9997/g.32790 Transcript_9997/m.32790 type:complete len:280 (+) Transcript_9997:149-988(+)